MRPVSGPAELNQRMIESGKVEACLSANYFRYAMRRDPTRDSADACTYEAMRGSLASGGALAAAFRGIAAGAELPPAQGGRAMKMQSSDGCSSRARAARCSPCPSSNRWLPRTRGRPDRDAAQAVHRAQVVQHAAGAGVVPALHRQRLRAQGQQVRRLEQGGRHHAADAEAGQRQELHLGAAHRLPDVDRHLRHPRAGAQPVPVQADADPRPRFPPRREPQLRRPAGQLLVVHGGHALRRRQPRPTSRPSTR